MIRKWRWLVVILILAAGLVVEVLYDPLQWAINSTQIAWYRIELPLARRRWERAGITDYQVEVRGGPAMGCNIAARLTYHQGELVEAEGLPLWPDFAPDYVLSPTLSEQLGCELGEFAVPQVFDELEILLGRVHPASTQVKISFNWRYGYVTHYEVNDGYRLGLFTPGVGECCYHYDFENFEHYLTR